MIEFNAAWGAGLNACDLEKAWSAVARHLGQMEINASETTNCKADPIRSPQTPFARPALASLPHKAIFSWIHFAQSG